ncbi:histidine kinase [Saccharopolyspora sp. K220]|uniref:sensor histidine kinase n=1 Tax=Saccharopolyspora soli TaxID=2926618 RepID=UPI001F56E02E|nr:histidine kinase [Saccharopolyspora soli]MCI2420858.1 histidine kinase [Saccharopolyspora soli]
MRWLQMSAWLIAVVLLAASGLLDHRVGTFTGDLLGWIHLGVGLLAVLVALAAPGLGSVTLPVGAFLVSAVMLVSNVLTGLDDERGAPLGFAATAAGLGLLAFTAWRGHRVLAAVAVPLLVVAIVTQALFDDPNEISVIFALGMALASVVMIAAGVSARLVALSRHRQAVAIRLAQRAEFARDLHDYVAHHVTGIVLHAQGARAVAAKQPQLVAPALERIEQAGVEAMDTMRRMVGLLRETDSAEETTALATIADIEGLVAGFGSATGPAARLDLQGEFEDVPAEIQATAHRVVMEALTNVRKHADGASEVDVLVRHGGDWITARVSNDGKPRHGSGGGFGLRGLAERVTALGGRIDAGPGAAGGWVLEAGLPAGRKR